MKSRRSIAWRIAGCLFGYVFTLFAILWVLQIELLPAIYQEYRKQQVTEKVTQMGENLRSPLFSKTVVREAREDTACIRILRQSGTEILSLDFMPYCNLHNMSKAELMEVWEKAVENGGSLTTVYKMDSDRLRRLVPTESTAILYVQVFQTPGREPTAIFYNSTISPINGMLAVLQIELRWVTVVGIIVAALLVIWVSRLTVRPITKIIEQTRRLKEQDYTVTFNGRKYYREVAELSDLLNETSQHLELLDKMRRELLARVSHDLRTPLSMVIAYAELMRDIPEENTSENLQVIIDEANRFADLIHEALIYPEPWEIITRELNCTMFDFAALCKGTVDRYQSMNKVTGHTISYEGPERLMTWADSIRLSQVIYNLLNNAISHSGDRSSIILRLEEREDHLVYVAIIDNGKGIAKDKQALIWKLNYSDTDQQEYHRGLGLNIVQSILEQHHAQYGVESTPGKGSTFWFSFNAFSRN